MKEECDELRCNPIEDQDIHAGDRLDYMYMCA